MINGPAVTTVRRRRSVFSIIGMLVVAVVVVVVAYFAYVGWNNKGKPVPDVDVKTDAVNLPAVPAAHLHPGTVPLLA